jgi:Putative Flp pilus-assembly TadE/G-like/von Willebrand factor type A domain
MNCGHCGSSFTYCAIPHGRVACGRNDERGQVFVFVALAMAVLIAFVGLAIDVGYAYYTSRALQASADAAALAGAQDLPDTDQASAVARAYAGGDGGKNARANIPGVQTDVSTRCLKSAPGCQPANAIVVTQSATVPTIFARVVGIDSFTVHSRATACSPCAARALDIMLVLDRTGSMCQDHNGRADPACTDLNNAREGMKTFLGYLDPQIDRVGLAAFPPARSTSQRCATPQTADYDTASNPYVLVPLSSDYSKDGALNSSSDLVSTIQCMKANGRTSYATAVEKAQAELDKDGRPDVQDVVIVLSDGAANLGPSYYPAGSPYLTQPCHQGVTSAQEIARRGSLVYTIGYDLNAQGGDANVCTNTNGNNERPAITAYAALQEMASDPGNFYNKPTPGQLTTIFTRIAADISRPAARLIPDDAS